ncbi:TetR/AcrR family transcriptional regulator [Albimonas sp. CAU 1670]|uniref:TetR/AcrR family transcriptional regulator n=1 Tax=Albimonas sp. CAU 1670 TaxID=3032599 RepID=UPI0023DA6437|nr:TetR/AcrR family transcriptional regulator [Albimonas sp. CAU 1670]MDF2231291.1 TetR/AcrR family transcriptional regulator [Albimonas sp. CAU 1670]
MTRTRTRRLTKDDWFREGQSLLMREGIAGMRLAKLVKRLGISTGSFYHHFTDMDDYLGQLADHYSSDQVRRLAEQVARDFDDPVEQIRTLAADSIVSGLFDLDRAMRVWAASDPRAAKALLDAEKVVLDFVSAAFERLGFAPADARLRAQILLSANLAQLVTLADGRELGFRSRVLDFLTEAPARVPAPAAADEKTAREALSRRRDGELARVGQAALDKARDEAQAPVAARDRGEIDD